MIHCPDSVFFFFNDTATTEIYTLSLHDALPICVRRRPAVAVLHVDGLGPGERPPAVDLGDLVLLHQEVDALDPPVRDRKSTRLNSSHANISYAVFCLKKKKT